MDTNMEDPVSLDLDAFSIPPINAIDFNISDLVFQVSKDDTEVTALSDPVYEQFLADVWVGIVLTLMVLSCVCFMCSCLIYHKFHECKQRVLDATRNQSNLEAGTFETDLPSYTIASGLPTYEEALEQLRKVQITSVPIKTISEAVGQETSELRQQTQSPLFNLFGIYNTGRSETSKPA
ncbi:unnamed protein product [Ceutorhynchus assimilis]|uniref:Uncharacterized protein n=1 Tax=Ceutorhynchus assimilis TaxID=467358 RepID=A0A9N9QF16_9CUCU|nr:unnamed protein product [Ceutorhynchus assimilis]